MIKHKSIKQALFGLALALVLISCRLLTPAPAPAPGVDVEQSVAQTVAAQLADEAQDIPPLETPTPVADPVVQPLETPTPVADPVVQSLEMGTCGLVFVSEQAGVWDLLALDFNSRQLWQLTAHDRPMGAAETVRVSVSPDGEQIAFNADMSGSQAVYVINVDGRGLDAVGFNPAWDDAWPDWSADGVYLAFGSNRDGEEQVYLMDAAGGAQERVTFAENEFRYPVFSPDGSQLAMVSVDDGDLYLLELMANQYINLTGQDFEVGPPDWSPDGERLVFSADLGGFWNIFVVETETGVPYQLTEGSHVNRFPVWSPDGNWIAFSSERDGQAGIYLMPAEGGEAFRLTDHDRQDLAMAWLPGCADELPGLLAGWDFDAPAVAGDPVPVIPGPVDDLVDPPGDDPSGDDPVDPSGDDPVDPPDDDPVDPPGDDPVDPPDDDPADPPGDDPVESPEGDPADPPEGDPVDPPDDPVDPPDDQVDPPEGDPVDPPEGDPVDPPDDDSVDPPDDDSVDPPDDDLDDSDEPEWRIGIPIIDELLEWIRRIGQRVGLIPIGEGEEISTVWEDLLDFLGRPVDDPVVGGIGQGVTATVTATLTPTLTATPTPTPTPTVTPTTTPTPEEDYYAWFRTSSAEGDIIIWRNWEGLEGTYTGEIDQYNIPFGSVIALTGAVFTLPPSPVGGACSGVEDCGMWRSEPFSYTLETVIEPPDDECKVFRTMVMDNIYLVITSYTPGDRATGDWVVGSAVVTLLAVCPDREDVVISSAIEVDALSFSVIIPLDWLPELAPIVPQD